MIWYFLKGLRENKINFEKKKKRPLIIFWVADNEPREGNPAKKNSQVQMFFSFLPFLIQVPFDKKSNIRHMGVD